MSKKKQHRCTFPNCKKESEFKVRERLSLCEEHYNLWKFIDNLLFEARIEINTRESRFEHEGKRGAKP